MINRAEVWRRRLWLWVPALVFFVANVVAFAVYQVGYAGQERSLEDRIEAQEGEMRQLAAQRQELQALVNRVGTNKEQVQRLYSERFATREERLTGITAEVWSLASKAGLALQDVNYPEEEIEDFGLIERSFIFTVEGTYGELRKFINLLELSPSFLTLQSVRLTGGGEDGPELRMDLTISTLFIREPGAAALTSVRTAGGDS
jgi:type IV pilus assembly protein PilO